MTRTMRGSVAWRATIRTRRPTRSRLITMRKCQACHGGGKAGAKACPVSKSKCVSCHMPKIELPGAHYKFSDHRIRIVKPNEPYPG